MEHEEAQFFEPQKKCRLICSERQFTSSAMRRLSTGFLGRATSSLSKVKATLGQGPMRKFSCLVGPWSELCQRVSVEKEYCNLRVEDVSFFAFYKDESMCAMRSALSVPIQMWKSTFMSWSFHVRLGICISFHDSFITSAETKGLDWKTHKLSKCS